jgi:hypothetical protein
VELCREFDQHQSRIGDNREQHLAQAFGLIAGQCRPGARGRGEVERAQPEKLGADACRGGTGQRLGALGRQCIRLQQREQHRAGQDVLVVRQFPDDVYDGATARDGALVSRVLSDAFEG